MNILILRFDAPLMSFGTVAVDNRRASGPFPTLSMITGLLGAALGYLRYETDKLQRLQNRLRFAARIDRVGEWMRDYQTVDLSMPWMNGTKKGVGWTTRGYIEVRGGADKTKVGTHIRLRDYWADRIVTLALSLIPEDEHPTLTDLEVALRTPFHPLYIGRKNCVPAAPILIGRVEEQFLREALEKIPRSDRTKIGPLQAQWPLEERGEGKEQVLWDRRDWANQVHTGERRVLSGLINPPIKEVVI